MYGPPPDNVNWRGSRSPISLMIKVDCSELSGESKLAFAEAISEGLDGAGLALLDGDFIVLDTLSGPNVSADRVQSILSSYISELKDASAYRIESGGKHIVIHSSVTVSPREKRIEDRLPPGLLKCPACGFVTTSEHEYQNHLRIHDLVRGLR